MAITMRRSVRWSRPFTALFALWFAVVLGDPGVLHSCPMHGGGHGAAHGAAEASAASMSHTAHGAHGASHGSADKAHQHDASGPCTCVGSCCAAATAAPLPAVDATHVPAVVVAERDPLAAPTCDAPASPDLRLPFANGPPAA